MEEEVWHGDSWGGGHWRWEWSEHTGLMFEPALGLRFGGNTFFVNPFMSFVLGISEWTLFAPDSALPWALAGEREGSELVRWGSGE